MKRLTEEQLQFIYDNATKSIIWISKEMNIGKSTISFHLKPYREKNNIPRANKEDSPAYRETVVRKRKEIDNTAQSFADSLWFKNCNDHQFIYGWIFYWCEGTRTKHFSFCNTNKDILLFFIHWLEKYFPTLKWTYRIKYPPDADVRKLEMFWQLIFNKPCSTSSLAKNTRSEFGVVQIEITGFKYGERGFVPIIEKYLAEYLLKTG